MRRLMTDVAALAAATLLLETTLTRLLAVAQFYHFAFLVVSLALLGFGASGAILSLPRLRASPLERLLPGAGAGFSASAAGAYLIVNLLPFDSYSIAWEPVQVAYFVAYYLALALPFLFAGLGIGAALAGSPGTSHRVYAANLLGSCAGAVLAPACLGLAGVPGAVLAAALIGLAPLSHARRPWPARTLLVGGIAVFAGLAVLNLSDHSSLLMTLSQYKGLSHAQRYPTSVSLFGRWNAISRLDVLAHAGTRLFPGLSYVYPGIPPDQHAMLIDADEAQPITLTQPEAFEAAAFLPEALAFRLRPAARVLVLEPGGGLSLLQALAGGAAQITAAVSNPLVPHAVARVAPEADPYANRRVRAVASGPRAFLAQRGAKYDIVFLPLTDAYRPVTNGAYSLGESYLLTGEAFDAALGRLDPAGLLLVSRWLQTPPSEEVRLLATLAEALQRRGQQPAEAIVAYRGIQTLTVLVQPAGWGVAELAQVREFTTSRRYDLVWAPDIQPDEVNRFNRLPAPDTFLAAQGLFTPGQAQGFYAGYPFSIAPTSDDRPFFFHFFRWGQTSQVLATLGMTWQPFGGSGYLILLALLALVLVLSAALIVAPLLIAPAALSAAANRGVRWRVLGYFGMLGLAYLFVEIPAIQRCILVAGHPTYAFTAVVLTILLGSSLGSLLARTPGLPRRVAFVALVGLALVTALAGGRVAQATLAWPLPARLAAGLASLAPLAVLMGLPFPLGLAWLEREAPALMPWAWAINGCASVIASVVAALLALSFGFTLVLLLGTATYALAAVALLVGARDARPLP